MANRWFRVVAERFDWMPVKTQMKSFKKGQIGYEPKACIDYGLAIGAIELIDKPANAKVAKDGTIVWNGN